MAKEKTLKFKTRDEAELVRKALSDIIDKYGVASSEDLNDLVGLPSIHTDHKQGWSTIQNVNIVYVLELPPPTPIY